MDQATVKSIQQVSHNRLAEVLVVGQNIKEFLNQVFFLLFNKGVPSFIRNTTSEKDRFSVFEKKSSWMFWVTGTVEKNTLFLRALSLSLDSCVGISFFIICMGFCVCRTADWQDRGILFIDIDRAQHRNEAILSYMKSNRNFLVTQWLKLYLLTSYFREH